MHKFLTTIDKIIAFVDKVNNIVKAVKVAKSTLLHVKNEVQAEFGNTALDSGNTHSNGKSN